MKKMLFLLLAIFQFMTLCSCGTNTGGTVENTKSITDINGDKVTIPANVQKVICRSGNGTSFIVAMGYADTLVGTADYVVTSLWADHFVQGISSLPTFGWSPSSEEIYAVGADLVMLADPEGAHNLRNDGINAICYKQYTESEILQSAELMGEIFGDEAKAYADRWIAYYREVDDYLDSVLQDIPEVEKPVVYYVYGQSNKGVGRTSGGGSIEQFWIEASGGIFATPDLPNDGPTITEEEAIKRDPDVILVGGIHGHKLCNEIMESPVWAEVSAVISDRVVQIPMGFLPWDFYGVEFPLLRLWVSKQLYPDLVEIDMHRVTKEFYRDFYDMTLSDEEVTYILNGLSPEGEYYAD